MDDVKIGEILLPGDVRTQAKRERTIRTRFWPTLKKAVRHVPFSRDLVAAYYCALDPKTPTRARGLLLAALAYFVMPFDAIPDVFAFVGFTDDIAVLAAALRIIQGHITDQHYQSADQALADHPDIAAAQADQEPQPDPS
jgi:uncharacterized membrane protein YkvA (DUF1232 family)